MEEELLWLLRHRSRRRIIMAIGEAGRISATALRDKLGISTGSLYYNLRLLEKFVQQDQKRNYMLTPEGQRVYKMLLEQQSSEEMLSKVAPSKFYNILSSIFFPVGFFAPIYENLAIRIFLPLLSIAVLSAFMIYARFVPSILHIFEAQRFTVYEFFLRFAISVLVIFIYTSMMAWIISGKVRFFKPTSFRHLLSSIRDSMKKGFGEHVKFLLCILISMLPLALFPAIITIDKLFNLKVFSSMSTADYFIVRDVLILLSQGIVLIFMVAGISYTKNLRWQSSAFICFTLFYISLIYNRFLGFT